MYQGISFRHLLLVLQLVQLPAVTQGKTVLLGREGKSIELPCDGSQRKSAVFTWKLSDQTKILGNNKQSNFVARAQSERFSRFDSRKAAWDRGSFPLVINKLKVEDSNTYICEVENKKTEVELWVFKLTVSPDVRLLQGQTLTLRLDSSSKVTNPSMKCSGPGDRVVTDSRVYSVPNLRIQDSGIWTCIVTQNQKKETVNIDISVLGFQKTSTTVYTRDGESAEFSFPLNFGDENLQGELKWRTEKDPSPSPWVTFSLENRKVTMAKDTRKLQMAEELPLRLKILQVSLENAGSGNLTLTLAKGTLHQEVTLVVLKLTQNNNILTCEVRGPTSPKMRLTLVPEKQEARVSKQEKVVEVPDPEAGLWRCVLYEAEEVKMNADIQVSSRGLNQDQPMFLAIVLGGTFSFLAFMGLCILCCVKCRHQRRQAERMSQIKRLLSEKKTCQCSHRMQKTQNFI
ncbi:T-cell surface glycoprotein CD4 isoform X2 [Mesocricetus auratus]|uniref:T-cell surface glycoprotein CD4 n=1 Tax=Mesocricetus auratus TaxID=10036 RepID=A0ABM2WXB5_MESAU|nr:T-cell surface glycoprotein CD4 isoform X2 [Mesocricetus auratus]